MKYNLPVTEEMIELIDTYIAALACRDAAIISCYRTNKAIKYSIKGKKALDRFWALAKELYPLDIVPSTKYNYENKCLNYKPEDNYERLCCK